MFIPFFHESDERFIDALEVRNTNGCIVTEFNSLRIDAKRALYKNATLAISMRFHSIAFAMYHAVPLIGICYAPKAKQLMKEYGLADFSIEYGIRKNEFFYEVFDIDENELDRVKQKVIGMIDSSELEVFRKASKRLKEEAAISVNILEEALDSSR